MTKDIWINLPVKNVVKSTEFFKALDFTFNTQYGNSPQSAVSFPKISPFKS
jgi:predicted lactoylglutathione lyase